jgi:DNA-binding IclR family transcriptional regulator
MAQGSVTTSSARVVFSVLRLAAASDAPLGISEISRRLRISVNKAYRAATTLENSGYLRRNQFNGKFEIGPSAEQLIFAAFQQFPLRELVAPYLRQIATATDATTSLAVRVGWYAVTLALVESGTNVISRPRSLGGASLLDRTAAGLAILACLPGEQVKRFFVFSTHRRSKSAPNRTATQRQLTAFKRAGFVSGFDDTKQLFALGLPLRAANGDPVGSIFIEATANRQIPLNRDPAVKDWIKIAAQAEKVVRAEPERSASPFAALDPDEISFFQS